MYKKFIFTLFLTFSLLFLIYSVIVLNYKMLYMTQEYPMWLHVKNAINTPTKNRKQLLIIGDSRAKAGFIPNEIENITSINLSLGGGTPMEGYYILKKYLENTPAPAHLILSYTAYHLMDKNKYWERTVTYNFLDDKDYQEIETRAKEFNERSIIKANKSYWYFKNPIVYRGSFRNGITSNRWKKNKQFLEETIAAQGHHYFGTSAFSTRLNTDTKQKIFKKSKLQDFYLRKLLTLAKNSGIKLYFFIMPFNKPSYDKVKKSYISKFTGYLRKLSHDYPLKICNKLTYMEKHNFGDSSHLFKGAKVVTLKMYHCLKQSSIP